MNRILVDVGGSVTLAMALLLVFVIDSLTSRPSGGTASGDPATGRVSSRPNASGPILASSLAWASLCCHWPISTCLTLNAATECQACHGSMP